ncbi:MAG TPA: hypothetical protein VHW95_17310 [Steroidobacteraceae bacterium]|jgi:hypothetical protein|nr:hypothetical protein [Steroidobacteraceae bacterium]
MRNVVPKLLAVPLCFLLLAITACSGSTVVTVTATRSSDPFITYRVGLTAIQLKNSSGKPGVTIQPGNTPVDFTKLFDVSEVLGAPAVPKGTYAGAVVTFDYSAALIIYDDGSLDGVQLTPVAADGKALGLISVSVELDPNAPILSAAKQAARLSLNIDLAASNAVDLNARTVTITPLVTASTAPIDTKPVRVHGPLLGANGKFLATGIMPFDGTAAGLGQLSITPSDSTTYEINGFVSLGAAGQAQLAALPANTPTAVFGTLTVASAAAPIDPPTTPAASAGATPTATPIAGTSTVTFTASQVLVDSSAAGVGSDRVSGIVSARSGNTLGIEDATLVQNNGANTFAPGTTIVNVGPNTLVTFSGEQTAESISPQQISVGSAIEAFGTAGESSSGQLVLDASAGRVRLDLTTASGAVTAQGAASLTLNLSSLGGRAISAFDFIGSGAAPDQYAVSTASLDLTNATVGAPVLVSGFSGEFGVAASPFTASALLDPTTIQAQLVIDWAGGTAAPFSTFNSTSIVLNVANGSIGARHQIQLGSQTINLVGLPANPSIAPGGAAAMVFSIGHASSSTVESFNTYDVFVTQLVSELNGTTLATRMTAIGTYTASTSAFSASSITLFLND